MSNQGANHYKQVAVKTANRGQLLIMLYEAAIQNLKKAQDALNRKDLSAKGTAIGKAHDIVNELMNTLDFDVGGQIAIDLERLYYFISEQLMKANAENSKPPIEVAEKILTTLLVGWKQAIEQVNKGDSGVQK